MGDGRVARPEPVTVTIARRVAPGREADFESWSAELTSAASVFPGYLGAGMLRPGHVGEPWHVVFRFDNAEHLREWEASPRRAGLLVAGEDLVHSTDVHRITGLETWFALPGRTSPAPPKWKMFLVSVVGIYTLQLVVNLALDPLDLPPPLRIALVACAVTALMTWLVMPPRCPPAAGLAVRAAPALVTDERNAPMPRFLVSGIADMVSDVAAVLREHGATVVEVGDIEHVPQACADAGPGAFDGYVQLPATFTVRGDSAVDRVHHFFSDGVLARFPAITAALPSLTQAARITFVKGVLPPEVSTEDDVAARAALVRVLGHAARADGPKEPRVTVLGSCSTPKEVALTALGRNPEWETVTAGFAGGSYSDWRVELLGMMSAQT